MSFRDCLNRGVAGGELDPKRAERIVQQYENLFRQFENTMGPGRADYEAARVIVDKTRREAKEKRRVKQLQADASRRLLGRLEEHRNIRGDEAPGEFVEDLISNRRGGQGSTLAGKYEAIRRQFRRELTAPMRQFSANLLGQTRNKELLKKVTREVFGESTGDEAAAGIAKAWASVSEKARTRFNAAGGHIGKREDWGLPQMHDSTAIRRAGYEEWRREILPKLDLEGMGRDFNDGVPFTEETLEILLKDAFDAIRSDGHSRRDPSARHGAAMYNRRADHRFFKFRNADDWLAYSQRFGAGEDTFRIMISHLENMANEIAQMEVLGPNPNVGYQFIKDAAINKAQRSPSFDAPRRTAAQLQQADAMFDLYEGRTNIPGYVRLAKGASAVRQYLTSAHLGSAVISSVTDFNTQRLASKFVGMRSFGFMRQLQRLMRDAEFRNEANEAGLIFENAINLGNAAGRYNLEEMHLEGAQRLADFTIRSSGLGYLTEVQRQAFGLEFMSTAARKWRQSDHANLDPRIKRTLEQYGIGRREWEVIREAEIHETANGLPLIRAQEIEALGRQDVADLWMEAITSMTEFAIPSSDLYGRAQILRTARPGTPGGELIRSALQFKAFPITLMVTQFSRILNEVYQKRGANALSYAAGLFIGNTILGAMAMQMKDTSKGKDPRDMTTPEFWIAAMAQGGGLGIFGDFLFSDVNRFGRGIESTLAGPTVGFLDDALRFSVGNAQEVIAGEGTNAGREFVQLLRNYTPGGSLWYLRLAYEREVLDQMQLMLDPKAYDSFRSRERFARETDTQFFAPPGSSLTGPRTRAPDINNAFGG